MQTIHQKFEAIVEEYPNNIAYSIADKEYTYTELNSRANRLAKTLHTVFEKDKYITVYSDQGIEHIATMLAISKAGKVIIPLNSMMPYSNVQEIMDQYDSKTLITDKNHIYELPYVLKDKNVYCHRYDMPLKTNLDLDVNQDDEFIIFNTSGSTGTPKGVVHTHRNFVFFIEQYQKFYDITSDDVHSLVYPTGFYGGIRDTLVSLLSGSNLCHYKKTWDLQQWIVDHNVSILTCTVKFYRDMINSIEDDFCFDSVRIFRPGGDASFKEDFEKFKKHFPIGSKYLILFASSETGIMRQQVMTHDTEIVDEYIPLGYPIDGVDMYVIDDQGNQIQDDGVEGTIVIEHKYLFKEYKNAPEVTKNVLGINPDTSLPRYISSDEGKFINGCLHFTGRKMHHVKINGARVDVNHVSATALKATDNAVCIYHPERKNLYLFYESVKNINETELKEYLLQHLPFYMVPARCILVDKIPATANDKINRNALIDRINNSVTVNSDDTVTGLQRQIAEIWADNLEIDEVGIDDNFFDTLNGDSITAAAIMVDMEEKMTISLKDHVLYEYSTVRSLTDAIEQKKFKTFTWIKKLIDGDPNQPPVFWSTGWPNVLKKKLKYSGNLYYIDSHYNHFTDLPDINSNIEEYCNAVADEIEKITTHKNIILAGYSLGAVHSLELSHILSRRGYNIDKLFLLDPKDTINEFQGEMSVHKYIPTSFLNVLAYWFGKLLIKIRYNRFKKKWDNFTDDEKMWGHNRRKYIHSVYSYWRWQYEFVKNTNYAIMIQRTNNLSRTRFRWVDLFQIGEYVAFKSHFKKHLDFFENDDCVDHWSDIFNERISL
jgi:acyl-coenzyme A synthetase/AMP-(fatty) acid ligase/acyl carrier protein